MNTPPLDRFLPAIDQFRKSVKKAYAALGLLAIIMGCMIALGITGFIVSSDFIVALSVASIILAAFLFYLLYLFVKENVVRYALSTKQAIEKTIETDTLDAGERGELYSRLALSIRSLPYPLVKTPKWMSWMLAPFNKAFGYVAWHPLHTLAEVLFLSAVDQHINRIKSAPTNLQYHACLANCYVMLANFYLEPIKTQPLMTWPGILLTPHHRSILQEKGRASSNSAIEELSILSSFAPDQLWVHDQLAISYRELEMPDREIEECETIISLCPDDHQALLRLGTLYFRQGKNSKGLEVYEKLKTIQPLLAEELISHYGAYTSLVESPVTP